MRAIRLVSVVHVLWGICLVMLPVPRPFGALEPFFALVSPFWVGVSFIIAGSLPLLALRIRWFTCLLCAVAPQQMVLAYGLIVSSIDAATSHDVRVIMALCYLGPMTFYHFKEGVQLAVFVWAGGTDDGLDG